jgi:hypothetical protein
MYGINVTDIEKYADEIKQEIKALKEDLEKFKNNSRNYCIYAVTGIVMSALFMSHGFKVLLDAIHSS